MPFSQQQLFIKCLLWALVGSALFVAVFLIFTTITNQFHGPDGASKFVDGMLFSSILGNLSGAGLVGWRIVDKYRQNHIKYWARRYISLSVVSIIGAIGLLYTPVTGLLAFWCIVASLLVQLALSQKKILPGRKN